MKIIKGDLVDIYSWCSELDDKALAQARNLTSLPFVFKHVCLMPDAHAGFGPPIGAVVACNSTVIPNAVGVDIGCGMKAIKTSLKCVDRSDVTKLFNKFRKVIPLGFKHHKTPQISTELENLIDKLKFSKVVKNQVESIKCQLGTLGGGNHFIEIQLGDDGNIWFMVHTGSRNLGKKVAEYHNEVAKSLARKLKSKADSSWDLAYLPLDLREAENYLSEMNFCLEFARLNRDVIANRITEIVSEQFDTSFDLTVNIHHNYASEEIHFGKKVLVHRKGATSARAGEVGIIPGSQGTSSFIVRGKGNSDSFSSSSHGAGRVMSRRQAQKNLDLSYEKKVLDDKGIVHSIRGKKDLDEASSAYKDIQKVMVEQNDLVEVVTELTPLGVIKG